jgi:hypothetical protein
MSLLTRQGRSETVGVNAGALSRHVYALSLTLALVASVAAGLTFFVPEILTGPAVTNGNGRGTALVMLVVAVPTLLVSMWWQRRDSWRATFFWLGALFYLAYNAFLLLFLTPFNSLFMLYVATQSLALFAVFALVFAVDRERLAIRMGDVPVKGLSVFVWAIVVLNALAWLQVVIPATFSEEPGSFLDGLGVATNAVFVQDLAVWLPLMTVAAWWMWKRWPLGILLTGSWLAFGVIESLGIAVDQWFGHRADPLSPHASTDVIPLMAGLALVNLVGLYFYLRGGGRSETARGGAV